MGKVEWSLHDAKNQFSAVVDAASKGTPQRVSKRGRPAVVVVSAEEYDRLSRLEKAEAPDFTGLLLEMPQDDGGFERRPVTLRDPGF